MASMAKVDNRLPEMTQGLGLVIDGNARFYPMRSLSVVAVEEPIGGRTLKVGLDPQTTVPTAQWSNGERPMQLFSRWYGFSLTFPGCSVYTPGESRDGARPDPDQ